MGSSNGASPMLAVGEEHGAVDLAAAERAAHDLLVALGADLESDHLRETPRRVAKAYAELLTPQPFSPTTFPNDEGYDELVIVGEIPFQSLCAHHLLPFQGKAHVAYLVEVETGLLVCGPCGRWYPIENGIPEMLTDYLRDPNREMPLFEAATAPCRTRFLRRCAGFGRRPTRPPTPVHTTNKPRSPSRPRSTSRCSSCPGAARPSPTGTPTSPFI